MPFDEPYFPQVFDVGNEGGAHIHFDSTGEYFYLANGQLAYQLLPSGATFFGGDSSIAITPSPAGGGKSSIHFTGVGISDAVISGGAIINNRQGQLSLNSPAAATGATLNLTGDDSSLPGSQPVAALNTTGGSSVSVTGWAGDNSKGGLFRVRIRDTAAAFHDMTFDGTTLNVPSNVEIAGAVASPPGVAHLEVKNSPGDLASVGIAVQAITGQTGALFETYTPAGTRSTSIDDVTGLNTIRAVCVGDNTVNQVRIWGTQGVPPVALGSDGDFAFRWGNITVAGQRLYYRWAGAWNATAV